MATCRVGFMTTSACPVQKERRLRECRVRLVPPRASTSSNNNGPTNKFSMDRRDVLLGLGGAAATAATVMTPGGIILPAMAAPLVPPELSTCHIAKDNVPASSDGKCCPPYKTAKIVPYDFPRTPLRVRRPAHEVKNDPEYMAKYTEAVRKMKELDKDHPWNFYQQAKIHCAYCNGAYDQVGYRGVSLQVHNSWHFLPWHRYYLHFFERILGKLINDDTFALPYWSFDVKEGMPIPEIFTSDPNSPLYNEKRNKDHFHPAIVDYNDPFGGKSGTNSDDELVQANMDYVQTTFKNSLQCPEVFMGDPLRAGQPESDQPDQGPGGLENIHAGFHVFVGPADGDGTDMGNFATAARDCVFYSLHGNVDRLWHLYRNFRGNRVEFNEPDWLESSYIFYDEHERVVSVKVKDCLNPAKLRYTYEEVPIPWMGRKVQKTKETERKQELNLVSVSEFGTQPRELGTSPLRVIVPRPKTNRKKKEKDDHVELLQIKDIQVASDDATRFNVFVAAPYGDLAGPDFGEFVGSFVRLPHKPKKEQGNGVAKHKGKKTSLKLGLTALLEDIEVDHVEKLVVTIVPVGGDITIGDVQIKLVKTDSPRLIA